MSNRRPDHGSRASLEREGDRGPRGPRPGSVVGPNKGLRAVFAPLVDYGDDSDEEEEPASPGDILLLNSSAMAFACWLACSHCCDPACVCSSWFLIPPSCGSGLSCNEPDLPEEHASTVLKQHFTR